MLNLNKNHHRHPEFISGSTRHCEQSEVISSRLPRPNGLAMTKESGRSMVEMLGVLAVIGVLSITGISGYTTAMNKHKANEILDAASKRAVAVSTQIQRGNTSPTLGEFEDNTVGGATFSETIGTQGTDKFMIQFTSDGKPTEEVWSQMQSIAGKTGVVRGYVDERLGLVYNNDLTTEAKASDYNNDEDGCDTTKYTWCSGSSVCLDGVNSDCSTTCGTDPCKSACQSDGSLDFSPADEGKSCNNGEGYCNLGVCKAKTNNCTAGEEKCDGSIPMKCQSYYYGTEWETKLGGAELCSLGCEVVSNVAQCVTCSSETESQACCAALHTNENRPGYEEGHSGVLVNGACCFDAVESDACCVAAGGSYLYGGAYCCTSDHKIIAEFADGKSPYVWADCCGTDADCCEEANGIMYEGTCMYDPFA